MVLQWRLVIAWGFVFSFGIFLCTASPTPLYQEIDVLIDQLKERGLSEDEIVTEIVNELQFKVLQPVDVVKQESGSFLRQFGLFVRNNPDLLVIGGVIAAGVRVLLLLVNKNASIDCVEEGPQFMPGETDIQNCTNSENGIFPIVSQERDAQVIVNQQEVMQSEEVVPQQQDVHNVQEDNHHGQDFVELGGNDENSYHPGVELSEIRSPIGLLLNDGVQRETNQEVEVVVPEIPAQTPQLTVPQILRRSLRIAKLPPVDYYKEKIILPF